MAAERATDPMNEPVSIPAGVMMVDAAQNCGDDRRVCDAWLRTCTSAAESNNQSSGPQTVWSAVESWVGLTALSVLALRAHSW